MMHDRGDPNGAREGEPRDRGRCRGIELHRMIRGRRVDGPQLVRFDGAGVRIPPKELRIPGTATPTGNPGVRAAGQCYRPSYTRLLVPGCYAYQVDGTTFSRTIVFRHAHRHTATSAARVAASTQNVAPAAAFRIATVRPPGRNIV
jgi:hypothetical protein